MWTYTLDGAVGAAAFPIIVSSRIEIYTYWKEIGPSVITVEPEDQAQFRTQATNIRAELNIRAA